MSLLLFLLSFHLLLRVTLNINYSFTVYYKNLNNWTVCYVVGLSSLGKVKKVLFFSVSEGLPVDSTPSNYSSFYGSGRLCLFSTYPVNGHSC